jgi:Domain of Unknown Function (DUF748)
MTPRLAWPVGLKRWQRWAIALGIAAVVLRVALPYALRPILESRAARAINARVQIGDVDLALYRAGIALEEVTVRPAGWTPETDNGDPPLIAWKRFAVAVRWLPLLRKTIQLRELVLESPRVAVDRLQDGGFNVLALVPTTPAEPTPAAPPPPPGSPPPSDKKSGWSYGVDRIVLRDGGVRFRDLTIAGVEPVELGLGSFEVEDIALSPAIYGQPAHVHLQARVDEGRFVLDANLTPHDDGGFALASHVKARRLPLRRTRVYVPKVGWSDLAGEFGGALDYTLETGGRNEVRGQVTVDGLTVHVPVFTEPGLAWKRLAVQVAPIDLAGHRANVRLVDLNGMYLVARARGGVVFPFIGEALTGDDANAGSGAGSTAPGTPPAAPAADEPPPSSPPTTVPPQAAATLPPAEVKPWQWSVGLVRLTESLLHTISPDGFFDTGVDLTVRHLEGQGDGVAPVALALVVGDGTVNVDGRIRVRPLGFDGRVKAAQVPLPDIVTTAGAFPPGVVQSAQLDADLGVAAGVLAPTSGDVRVEGTIAFDDPKLVGAGGPTVEFGAKRLAFGMKELLLPGALPEEPPIATADGRLTGGTVSVEDMRVTRTEPTPLDLRVASLDANIDDLTAPGIGPPPADGGALRLQGKMGVTDLFVGNAGGSALDIASRRIEVGVGDFVLPGMLAMDRAAVTAPLKLEQASLTLAEPSAVPSTVVSTPQKVDARARAVTVVVGQLLVPGAMGGVPGDTQLRGAKLDVAEPRVIDSRVGKVDVRARSIDVDVDDLVAPPAGAAAGPRLRGGRLALAEPAVAGADPKQFAVGARSIGVGVQAVDLPGATAAGATRVRLRDVTFASPRVQVTRTAEGIELPFGSSNDGAGQPPAATTTTPSSATPAPAAARPAPPPPPPPPPTPPPAGSMSAAAPGLDVVVDSFRLTDGRIGVTDRTVKPFYGGGLDALKVDLADVRWPAMATSRLRVEATSAQKGKITISGAIAPSGGKLQVDGREIPLQQFNPYATTLSPYSIRRGRLSLATTATFTPGKYDTESHLTLHDFDIGSRAGDSLFKEQFGIPLTMALALLRDLQGNIVLDIPVQGDQQGMHVGYMTIIAGALRHALLNALTSPLKLLGGIFSGDKVQATPQPIAFHTGRDTIASDGSKQIDALGRFLADRPGMGVALQTAPTKADVRWMREHDLLDELGAPQGVFGTLRNLPKRGVRDRIRDALAARAEDKAGELDADDQKTLEEWLDQRPVPTPERIQELATGRLARVEQALRNDHGIDAGRIVRRDPPADPADATPPAVEIDLGSVEDLKAPPPAS